jgi:uncharacterized Fe-S cluster protein YjdI
VRHGAPEQRAANAAATMCWEDRETNFGDIAFAGKMCQTNKHKPIVVKAEDCVVGEVYSVDMGGDDFWRKPRSEAQVPVPHGQRKKVRHERSACALFQALDRESHHHACSVAASCATGAPRLWNKAVTPARIPIAIRMDEAAAIAATAPWGRSRVRLRFIVSLLRLIWRFVGTTVDCPTAWVFESFGRPRAR